METVLIKTAQLLLSLSILVLVHEFGHFIFSKFFKVRVEKFYLFFNPWFTLFKYKPKNSETEYGIGWLPLGGYCKISGMIDESMDTEQMKQPAQPWEFRSKPAWQRLLIMVGGVMFNFILAIIIYAAIAFHWGTTYLPFKNAYAGMEYCQTAIRAGFQNGDIPLNADGKPLEYMSADALEAITGAHEVQVLRNGTDTVSIAIPENFMLQLIEENTQFATYRIPNVIHETTSGQGAAVAGMQKGDRIVGIDRIQVPSLRELHETLAQKKDTTVSVEFIRNGERLETTVHTDAQGKIGISIAPIAESYELVTQQYGFFASIPQGIEMGVNRLSNYVSSIKYVFTKEGAQSLGGFIAIGNIFPSVWDWEAFWNMTAFLSIILAFMNILPIPALDGGHVLFLLYEVITRRKPSDKFLENAQVVGMFLLLALLIFANGNDIIRLFK